MSTTKSAPKPARGSKTALCGAAKPETFDAFVRVAGSLTSAMRTLRTALAAFGPDREGTPDLEDLREVVFAGKTMVRKATDELLALPDEESLSDDVHNILMPLFDTIDVLHLVVATLKANRQPDWWRDEKQTIRPITGALSVVASRLEQSIAELTVLIDGKVRGRGPKRKAA